MKNYFEVKKNIVLTGNSRIFNNWAEHSSITADDFIVALEWVCDDPLDANGMLTREIALAPDGIVKLRRINDHHTGITSFYKCAARMANWEPSGAARFSMMALCVRFRFLQKTVFDDKIGGHNVYCR